MNTSLNDALFTFSPTQAEVIMDEGKLVRFAPLSKPSSPAASKKMSPPKKVQNKKVQKK